MKPKGLIRWVLMVVSNPVAPTQSEMAKFLIDVLPELNTEQGGSEKIATQWVTKPMADINITELAIQTFGSEIYNNDIYTYRTLNIKLQRGEAKLLAVYDKAVAAPRKRWWKLER